jgi:hypothetical protein
MPWVISFELCCRRGNILNFILILKIGDVSMAVCQAIITKNKKFMTGCEKRGERRIFMEAI